MVVLCMLSLCEEVQKKYNYSGCSFYYCESWDKEALLLKSFDSSVYYIKVIRIILFIGNLIVIIFLQ